MRLVVQVPCLNEEETLPLVLSSDPEADPGHRRDHRADHRRRLDRPHRRGRQGSTASPTSSGTPATAASAGRSTTACSARWSSAPTSWSTPTATTSTRRSASATWSQPILRGEAEIIIGDRQTARDRALLRLQEEDAAVRQLGRQQGGRHHAARRGLRLPGLLAGQPDAAEHHHPVQLLHGDDHPGRQQEAEDRQRPDPHQPEDPRIAAVQVDARAHDEVGRGDHPVVHHVQAVRDLHVLRRCCSALLGLFFFVRFGILRLTGDNRASTCSRSWSARCC